MEAHASKKPSTATSPSVGGAGANANQGKKPIGVAAPPRNSIRRSVVGSSISRRIRRRRGARGNGRAYSTSCFESGRIETPHNFRTTSASDCQPQSLCRCNSWNGSKSPTWKSFSLLILEEYLHGKAYEKQDKEAKSEKMISDRKSGQFSVEKSPILRIQRGNYDPQIVGGIRLTQDSPILDHCSSFKSRKSWFKAEKRGGEEEEEEEEEEIFARLMMPQVDLAEKPWKFADLSCGLSGARMKGGGRRRIRRESLQNMLKYRDCDSEVSVSLNDLERESVYYLTNLGRCNEDTNRFERVGVETMRSNETLHRYDTKAVIGLTELQKYRSLSQKYRPKFFSDIVGQAFVTQSLSNAILKGRIAPAYLFHGPRGTGKTCTARIFSAGLNCLISADSELRPCGFCKECISYTAGINFDVREVDVAGNNGIQIVKSLLTQLAFSPSSSSRYKVFIIDDCHMLTTDAWNLLIKSLEEPPIYVVFIFITTNLESVPHSAVSRCQKFMFLNIKESNSLQRLKKLAALENIEIEEAALQLIVSRSDGSLRDAEIMFDQLTISGQKVTAKMVRNLVGLISDDKLLQLLECSLSLNTGNTIRCIKELIESGVEPVALISQLANLITNILFGKMEHVTETFYKGLEDSTRLRKALKVLYEAENQLHTCKDKTTWLTAALLKLAPTDSYPTSTLSVGTSSGQSQLDFSESVKMGSTYHNSNGQPNLFQEYFSRNKGDENCTRRYSHNAIQAPCRRISNFVGSFDGRIYPFDHSFQSVSVESELYDHRQMFTATPAIVDYVWKKVLQQSHSNSLQQFLSGHCRLISLSVCEVFASALLEFPNLQLKSQGENARQQIVEAFQEALWCPVEIKMSSSCSQRMQDDADGPILASANIQCLDQRISVIRNQEPQYKDVGFSLNHQNDVSWLHEADGNSKRGTPHIQQNYYVHDGGVCIDSPYGEEDSDGSHVDLDEKHGGFLCWKGVRIARSKALHDHPDVFPFKSK